MAFALSPSEDVDEASDESDDEGGLLLGACEKATSNGENKKKLRCC
jgi:hypothetical protein